MSTLRILNYTQKKTKKEEAERRKTIMVYLKKRTIIICVVLAVVVIGLLAWGLFPTNTLKPIDSEATPPTNNVGDIDMYQVATKSWANGKWLGDIDKESITTIAFTNQAFKDVEANKAWEYDGLKFALNQDTITIYVPAGIKMQGSLHGAFQDMTNLKSITGFAYFDTSECTEMSSMFANCVNLIAVDAPNLKTDNVLTANKMFFNCKALEHIDLTKCNMQNVIDMSEMFYGCEKAKNIGLPKTKDVTTLKRAFSKIGTNDSYTLLIGTLNTPNCTDMSEMFAHSMIQNYTIAETFDTTSLKTAKSMFESCGLGAIDLSQWKTSNLETTERMFYDNMWCSTINVSTWDVPKLENTSLMFYYCSRLKDLELNWTNARSITNTTEMFKSCYSLNTLYLTGLNNIKIGNTGHMFESCSNLKTIYCDSIQSDVSYYMFTGCVSLQGAVAYDANKITGEMANTNGYFTPLNSAPNT